MTKARLKPADKTSGLSEVDDRRLKDDGEEKGDQDEKLTLEELVCALSRPRDAAYASAGSVGCPFTQERARGAGPIAAGGRVGLLGPSSGAEAGDPSEEDREGRRRAEAGMAAGGEAGRKVEGTEAEADVKVEVEVEVEGITGFAAQGWIEVRGTKSSIRDPARQQQARSFGWVGASQ